jgi:hypothetical protein
MNRDQAIAMFPAFRETRLFTDVRIEHRGWFDRLTDDVANDGKWQIELLLSNPRTGNHTLEIIADYHADANVIARLARKAAGTATKRDIAALDRMAAEDAS